MPLLPLLYRGLLRAAARPLASCLLRRRSRRSPAYLQHWDERFALPLPDPVRHAVWIHAVSVGETRAAVPLAAALRPHFPDTPLLLTQMTPTGRAAAQSLFPDAQCRYLPYDRADWAAAFLDQHRPRAAVFMETEIWPNLLAACQTAGIPAVLANARLSERSARAYAHWPSLFRPAFAAFAAVLAQSADDAARFVRLGAKNVAVCGNTKYDIAPPPAAYALADEFRRRCGGRPVAVCASTRRIGGQDEEALLLQAWRSYRGDALLVIVPRHPERFDEVFNLAVSLGFKTQRRSDNRPVAADTRVWIGDSMGELFAYYLAADAAFVGGSLVDGGCQNIIEPLACGLPVLFGPSTYNFADACRDALAAGAAFQVASAQEWCGRVGTLLADGRRRDAAERNRAFIARHQGASERMAAAVAAAAEHCPKRP